MSNENIRLICNAAVVIAVCISLCIVLCKMVKSLSEEYGQFQKGILTQLSSPSKKKYLNFLMKIHDDLSSVLYIMRPSDSYQETVLKKLDSISVEMDEFIEQSKGESFDGDKKRESL